MGLEGSKHREKEPKQGSLGHSPHSGSRRRDLREGLSQAYRKGKHF